MVRYSLIIRETLYTCFVPKEWTQILQHNNTQRPQSYKSCTRTQSQSKLTLT